MLLTVGFVAPQRASAEVLPEGGIAWEEGKTVYANGKQYATLIDALTGVFMSSPHESVDIYCKSGADVGTMTHGHVADTITIWGNDAYVSGGERDLEIDTYQYNRSTGKQDNANGSFLEKDIDIVVNDLNGIALWGQRNTGYTVNATFNGCANMQRVYVSGGASVGELNVALNDCSFSFDASRDSYLNSNQNTTVYSNCKGTVAIKDCTFENIAVALNMNNKSNGLQKVVVENTVFTDCAIGQDATTKEYEAGVRVLATGAGATSDLVISGCKFKTSENATLTPNGNVLLGDGRHNAITPGNKVTFEMTGTTAKVTAQKPGFWVAGGGNNASLAQVTEVASNQVATGDTSKADAPVSVSCVHLSTKLRGVKDATCIEAGYTGDTVCVDCETVVATGAEVMAKGHQPADRVTGAKDATCTEAGYTGDTFCTVCSKIVAAGSEIEAKGHKMVVKSDADKTWDECSVCGEKANVKPIDSPANKPSVKPEVSAKPDVLPATGDFSAPIGLVSAVGAAFVGTGVARRRNA